MAKNAWWIEFFRQWERETWWHSARRSTRLPRLLAVVVCDVIEAVFEPLLHFLVGFEKLLLNAPWWSVLLAVCVFAYLASRSWKIVAGTIIAFLFIGYFGMWEDTMSTMSMIAVSTLLAIAFGVPVGILMARSNRTQRW